MSDSRRAFVSLQPERLPGLPQLARTSPYACPDATQPSCLASAEHNPPARAMIPMIINRRKRTSARAETAPCSTISLDLLERLRRANTTDRFEVPASELERLADVGKIEEVAAHHPVYPAEGRRTGGAAWRARARQAVLRQRLSKMWAVVGFLLAAAIGLVAVLAVGRRGSAQSDHIRGYSTTRRNCTSGSWPASPASPSRDSAGRDPRAGPARHGEAPSIPSS